MSMSTNASHRGYSLLELIVSIGIFSVVMLVVTGAYLTLVSLDRQARANNQLAASLSFAVESMARAMRTGSEYAAGPASQACPGASSSISFRNSENELITYRLRADGSVGQCTGGLCTDATAVALTDQRITVSSLCFYVRGVGTSGVNAYMQPQVTFVTAGTMQTDSGELVRFSIQSGATQRLIEL